MDSDCYREVHPILTLGWVTAAIPLSNHNQAPRVIYQCGMAKQAIAGAACITRNREHHVQLYTQQPMVYTTVGSLHNENTTFNAVVAVMSLTGYNIEDSVIVKRSSAERGMGTLDCVKVYTSSASTYEGNCHMNPARLSQCSGRTSADCRHIGSDGLPKKGAVICPGDVVIGKVVKNRSGVFTDQSVVHSRASPVIVTRVSKCQNASNLNEVVSVYTRHTRTCEVGDKLASRHAQKGTIGFMMEDADMPYTARGMSPDIIINPHCLPSRMTVGHLFEMLAGRVHSRRRAAALNPLAA